MQHGCPREWLPFLPLSTLTCVSLLWETTCQETLSPRQTYVCHLWGLVDLSLLTLVNSTCVFCLLVCFVGEGSYHIALTGLELTEIWVPPLSECWDKSFALSHLGFFLVLYLSCLLDQDKNF